MEKISAPIKSVVMSKLKFSVNLFLKKSKNLKLLLFLLGVKCWQSIFTDSFFFEEEIPSHVSDTQRP